MIRIPVPCVASIHSTCTQWCIYWYESQWSTGPRLNCTHCMYTCIWFWIQLSDINSFCPSYPRPLRLIFCMALRRRATSRQQTPWVSSQLACLYTAERVATAMQKILQLTANVVQFDNVIQIESKFHPVQCVCTCPQVRTTSAQTPTRTAIVHTHTHTHQDRYTDTHTTNPRGPRMCKFPTPSLQRIGWVKSKQAR